MSTSAEQLEWSRAHLMLQSRRADLIVILLVLLLSGPAIYAGNGLYGTHVLRQDLRERGVRAEVISAQGECRGTRNRISNTSRATGCRFDVRYALRPQEGGGERRARLWLAGGSPIFAPSALYDPADPSRVMFDPEVRRDMTSEELAPPFLMALLPLVAGGAWFGTKKQRARGY